VRTARARRRRYADVVGDARGDEPARDGDSRFRADRERADDHQELEGDDPPYLPDVPREVVSG
jgi:hypothetical protein